MSPKFHFYDINAHTQRIQLVRQIVGPTQKEFAHKIGIDHRRWNNFERGYPVPREILIKLVEELARQGLPELSVDWLLFGWEQNLSPSWRQKIRQAHAADARHGDIAARQDKPKKKARRN